MEFTVSVNQSPCSTRISGLASDWESSASVNNHPAPGWERLRECDSVARSTRSRNDILAGPDVPLAPGNATMLSSGVCLDRQDVDDDTQITVNLIPRASYPVELEPAARHGILPAVLEPEDF